MTDGREYSACEPNIVPEKGHAEPSLVASAREQPPLRWREVIAILCLIALCDATIYRGHGFAGYALLFIVAPALLLLGSFRPHWGASLCILSLMLVSLAVKMAWCGSVLLVAVGFEIGRAHV